MEKRKSRNILLEDAYKENKRSSILLYMILRFFVILCMVLQILNGNMENACLCLLSLVLLLIPLFVQKRFRITLPNALEIAIYLFIFSAEILGEINNFYGIIPFWDTLLHTINGFLAAAIGFSFIDLLNENSKRFNLSPFYLCLVAFCFSMTIGIFWEFFEFGADTLFKKDMQKDRIVSTISSVTLNLDGKNKPIVIKGIEKSVLYDSDGNVLTVIEGGYLDIGIIDTMKDLFVNFIGAFAFSIFGYFTLKFNRKSFISNFIPTGEKRRLEN